MAQYKQIHKSEKTTKRTFKLIKIHVFIFTMHLMKGYNYLSSCTVTVADVKYKKIFKKKYAIKRTHIYVNPSSQNKSPSMCYRQNVSFN